MNYIHQLQADVARLEAIHAEVNADLQAFIAFLSTDKFTGYEYIQTGTGTQQERKDWISTGDVANRLRGIIATLQEGGQ